MGRPKAQDTKKISKLSALFYMLVLFLIYIFFFILAICGVLPADFKEWSIKHLVSIADIITDYGESLKNLNCKFIFLITYIFSMLFGFCFLFKSIFWIYRTSEFLRFFSVFHYKNPFYQPDLKKDPSKLKEYQKKVTDINKELTQKNLIIDSFEKNQIDLEHVNAELSDKLDKLSFLSQELSSVVDQNNNAWQELYKLMSFYLMMKNDSMKFINDFPKLMDEFANSIIKVTMDKGVDKYSSIMIIDPDYNYLKIIGSNGLDYKSRSKTFKKEQGFAGTIWVSKNAEVCDDVGSDERFQQDGCLPSGLYRSIIGVPIIDSDKEVIGILFVQCRRPGRFDIIKDKAILSYFSTLLAIIFNDYFSLKEKIVNGEVNTAN